MDNIRKSLCALCLGTISLTTAAETLFELAPDSINYEPNEVLVADNTLYTPSTIDSGQVEIIDNYAGISDNWLQFKAQTCSVAGNDQISFDIPSDKQTIKISGEVISENLTASDNVFSMRMHSSDYSGRTLSFHGLSRIYFFNFGTHPIIENFSDQQSYSFEVDIDANQNSIAIAINNVELYSGALSGVFGGQERGTDISSISLSMGIWTGAATHDCDIPGAYLRDFVIETPELDAPNYEDRYHITLDENFVATRSGAINADVVWVFNENGEPVLSSNGKGQLKADYFRNQIGNSYTVHLEEVIEGSYHKVSNTVSYQPSVTDTYYIELDESLTLTKSGNSNTTPDLTVKADGQIVWQQAMQANSLSFPSAEMGTEYHIYLVDPESDEIISNTIEYIGGEELFAIEQFPNLDTFRQGPANVPIYWVVETNGDIVFGESASDPSVPLSYDFTDGNNYRVWLQADIPAGTRVIGEPIDFGLNVVYPYALTLDEDYTINRSGELGESLSWVVLVNGNTALQRLATNELSFYYGTNPSCSTFEVYLTQFSEGAYRQVSNSVMYFSPCN